MYYLSFNGLLNTSKPKLKGTPRFHLGYNVTLNPKRGSSNSYQLIGFEFSNKQKINDSKRKVKIIQTKKEVKKNVKMKRSQTKLNQSLFKII